MLGQIDGLGIGFLALQRRDQGLGSQLRARPAAQWCQVQLHNAGRKHLEPLVLDQRTGIGGYLKTLRRPAADGLGSGARCC